MQNLLFVRASIFAEQGQSSQLAASFANRFRGEYPEAGFVLRDVQQPALPHLDAETFQAFGKSADALTEVDRVRLTLSDELIDEVRAATDLLIALPMYNFAIPSAFKAWIDHVARARVTFRYTASGPQGLLTNIQRCWVVATRGGQYHGTSNDTQTPYLATMLGFLGIPKPVFIYAEGMARPDVRAKSLAAAQQALMDLPL